MSDPDKDKKDESINAQTDPDKGQSVSGLTNYQFFADKEEDPSAYSYGVPDWFSSMSAPQQVLPQDITASITESITQEADHLPEDLASEDYEEPFWLENRTVKDSDLRAVRQARPQDMPLSLNLEKDPRYSGVVLPAELEESVTRIFGLVDLDFNGYVDFDEMSTVLELEDLSASEKGIVKLVLAESKKVLNAANALNQGESKHFCLSRQDFRLAFAREYASVFASLGIKRAEVGEASPLPAYPSGEPKSRGALQLFANTDFPLTSIKADAVKLGTIGDSYFAAVICSVAENNPRTILRMVRTNLDGSYSILFPGSRQPPFDVMPPRKDELESYGMSEKYGFWYPLLEKSYGIYLAKKGGLTTQFAGLQERSDVATRAALALETCLMTPYEKLVVPNFSEGELFNKLAEILDRHLVAIAITHDDMSRLKKGPQPVPAKPYPILSVSRDRRSIWLNSIYPETVGVDLDVSPETFTKLFRLVFFEKEVDDRKLPGQTPAKTSTNPWKKI